MTKLFYSNSEVKILPQNCLLFLRLYMHAALAVYKVCSIIYFSIILLCKAYNQLLILVHVLVWLLKFWTTGSFGRNYGTWMSVPIKTVNLFPNLFVFMIIKKYSLIQSLNTLYFQWSIISNNIELLLIWHRWWQFKKNNIHNE